MMHTDPALFVDAQAMIEWCNQNNIRYLAKQLDNRTDDFFYNTQQVVWFENMYNQKSYKQQNIKIPSSEQQTRLSDVGRACCGGRQLCSNQNYSSRVSFVNNNFTDWFCSVNHFFLYIKQVNGEIFVNKDCKMNFENSVGPIGHLSNSAKLLEHTRGLLNSNTVIQCKKTSCICGLCAPKAQSLDVLNKIMEKYQLS